MPIPASRLNPDGSLKPFTDAEIRAFGLTEFNAIRTFNVRQGDHRTKKYAPDGNSVEYTSYFIKPEAEESFKIWMLGCVKMYTDVGVTPNVDRLSRLMPQVFPGTVHTAAMGMTTKGQVVTGANTDTNIPVPSYEKLIASVDYHTVPFTLRADSDTPHEYMRYVETLPTESMTEYLTLPGGAGLKFCRPLGGAAPHGKGIPYNVGLPIISGKVRRKMWRVPREAVKEGGTLWNRIYGDPDTGEIPLLGTVNSAPIFGYPEGVLLLESWNPERAFDPVADDYCFNVVVTWKYCVQGCNYLFAPPAMGGPGFFLATKSGVFNDSSTLPDDDALYNTRPHAGAFTVG